MIEGRLHDDRICLDFYLGDRREKVGNAPFIF
jgi:hypothetical protein